MSPTSTPSYSNVIIPPTETEAKKVQKEDEEEEAAEDLDKLSLLERVRITQFFSVVGISISCVKICNRGKEYVRKDV